MAKWIIERFPKIVFAESQSVISDINLVCLNTRKKESMSDGIIHSNSLLHGWNCNLHFIDSYKNARFAQNWLLFFCWWLTFWQRKEVLPAAAASSSQHQKRKLHTRFLTSSNFSPLYASAFRHQTKKNNPIFPWISLGLSSATTMSRKVHNWE